jgi:hypothetical protein
MPCSPWDHALATKRAGNVHVPSLIEPWQSGDGWLMWRSQCSAESTHRRNDMGSDETSATGRRFALRRQGCLRLPARQVDRFVKNR